MGRREDDLERELRTHLELEAEEGIDAGLSRASAEYAAHAAFGNVTLTRERTREMWGWMALERFWQDIKYALRTFRRSPGFLSVALLSLALGIGATTALFSVVYGVLIAPYPYAHPEQIWAPAVVGPHEIAGNWHVYTRAELLELQKSRAFSGVMATEPGRMVMTGGRSPENEDAIRVTGNAFDFIGVKPLLGRTLQPYDVAPGGVPAAVVVVSYGFWHRVFGGQPSVLGASIVLDDVPHTIVGVMPPRFGWWTSEGVWLPMSGNLANQRGVNVIMRLAPGVSPAAAAASLQSLNLQLAAQSPKHFPAGPFRTALLNYMDITAVSGEMVSSLHLLLAAVGFLLLITCANVANLQLARTSVRAREIAMRLSIGAGRGRIARQLLTESVLLSLAGGVAGVLFALALTKGIVALMPASYVPNEVRIAVNGSVLLFSFAISVATGVLFGLAPAVQCTKPNLADALKEGARGSGSSAAGVRMRGALVVAEVALSVILLAGASLAVRSFAALLRTDPGFQPERTLMLDVPLAPKRYPTLNARNAFNFKLLQSATELPGVEAATIGNGAVPFGGPQSGYSLDGVAGPPSRPLTVALISGAYARTLGIPMKRGRALTDDEVARGAHVALINETAAKLWPAGADPLGRTLSVDRLADANGALLPPSPNPVVTVVGILADTRNIGLRDKTAPGVFVPFTLLAPSSRVLAVRTRGEPTAVLNALRTVVRGMDRQLPLGQPIPLDDVLGGEKAQPRFTMSLLACFAALGLALATAGIYSVISCDVTRKVHEIGVRLALGATRGNVVAMVMKTSARMVALGLGIGLAGSIALERFSRFEFFGSVTLDWLSVAALLAGLSAVATLAAWSPARRAAGMQPVDALRYDA